MTKRIYIGLLGRLQHGKSTLARELQAYFGARAVSTAFADPIKNMLLTLGLGHDQLWGSSKGKATPLLGGHTPRHAMQTLGTEWGRELMYPDMWLDAWYRHQLWNIPDEVEIVIIEDVRFLSEVQRLQGLNAILLEVHRPTMEPTTLGGKFKAWLHQLTVHPSEKLNFRKLGITRINNSGSPEYMVQQVLARFPELRAYTPVTA